MGIVYEAEQPALARRVALKVMPMGIASDPRALERFQLEAQVAGWLQHPHIVPVYGVGTVGDIPYYVMQYIDGCSLATIIAELRRLLKGSKARDGDPAQSTSPTTLASSLMTGRFAARRRELEALRPIDLQSPRGPLEPDRPLSIQTQTYFHSVVRLGIQAAEALDYAHDRGVVHRDVKPANLLLDQQGELWIADFGMANVNGEAGLTLTGDLPGTLRYMSPEQASGKRGLVDRRTDIYSLGATLYELLALETVVTASDRLEILQQIAESEPVPLRRLNPSVPVDLATIVAKSLSKEASSRYETALQLADDLNRFLDGRPIAARPVGPLARTWRWCRRKPLLASLAASLVLAVAGGFAGITFNWREAVRQKHEAVRQKQLVIAAQRQTALERDQKEEQRALAVSAAAKAEAMNDFLLKNLLKQADPENNPVSNRVTLLEVLDRAAATVGTAFSGQPETEASIRIAIAETYHGLGEYAKSEPHYRAARELLSRPPHPSDASRLKAMAGLGDILMHLKHLDEAGPLLESVVAEARERLGEQDQVTLDSVNQLARYYHAKTECDKARTLYQTVAETLQRAKDPNTQTR